MTKLAAKRAGLHYAQRSIGIGVVESVNATRGTYLLINRGAADAPGSSAAQHSQNTTTSAEAYGATTKVNRQRWSTSYFTNSEK